MELLHILKAIQDLENGMFNFNNREDLNCFLYQNTWYPVLAIINRASVLSGENRDYRTSSAIVKLHEIFDFVIVKQILVENNILVQLNSEEKFELITSLVDKIKELSN